MSDITAFLYIQCDSKEQLKRLVSYLDEDTRPDFADDLQENERELFALIEDCPLADEIVQKSDTELQVFFEHDAFEAMQELPKLLAAIQCENAIYMQDSHDETLYYKLSGDSFSFLYSPLPLEDERDDQEFNRKLNGDVLDGAKAAYEIGRLSLLLYLGRSK
jgi:hypothetical protein